MAKYAGIAFLLKLGSGASPNVYTTIAGQRTTSLAINNEQIDVTDKDDSRWRKLIEGGVRSCSISASGTLQNAAAHATLLTAVAAGSILDFQLVFADKTLTGEFLVAGFEAGGEYTAEQTYSITLESASDIAIA